MPIPEPPSHADDTRPTSWDVRPTEPRRPKRRSLLPLWLSIALILVAGVSLIFTIAFALRQPSAPIALAPNAVNITVIINGKAQTMNTQAATVDDLLREENILLRGQDAISETRDTALIDGMTLTIDRARNVDITIDGVAQSLRTPYENPKDILDSANIQIKADDLIWLDGTQARRDLLPQWTVPVSEIIIERTHTVTIVDGEETQTLVTTADTVGDALLEANIDLFLTDIVSPDLSTQLSQSTRITIDRAKPVTILVDGTTVDTRVRGETVADALSESGIALVGLDYAVPAEDMPIDSEMQIQIVRVTERIDSYEETLGYDTVFQADANMELDQRQVIQAGQTGIRRYDERVRYENGEEISREPIGEELVRAPQNEVIAYGTNIVMRPIQTPDGTKQYWRKLRVYATSYKPESVGGSTTTAIGMTLQKGIIGADPTIIPYRTNMYVEGYGTGIMADTGGARSSPYWIDLGYSDEDFEGWHWYTDVYLLAPVPENINYLLPAWRPMRGLPDNG